jgi:hypothetical protein
MTIIEQFITLGHKVSVSRYLPVSSGPLSQPPRTGR